ncbi:MAG: hypothetical protein HON68_07865 [Gammaproteobacteria bacterium]|jgi:hypothetical protein|nr:hypothetical protein [Gammaproteobacteria bacterium]MBT3488809.1 hypothetical protein [Gammaproteobacteria bacterium]MBT3718002.1 hypothetical protein [Gammaproteobacteria bacterium]MBT3844682.1 hypothetical protein [Gammaproteobacteria bacterium]MBT3892919.1 hypothetical protein [Gammaproteobacteria bacterium]
MSRWVKILATSVLSLLLVVQGDLVLAKGKKKKGAPVTMIMNVDGEIEYSKNGKKWKKVRRNKFLFPGYQIRTGANGKGTFLNQKTSMSRALSANTVVEITAEGAKATSGTLGEAVEGKGNLVASLGNRFKKGQKYTTVRRGLKIKLGAASDTKRSPYKLAAAWPELVWDNVIENPVVKKAAKITDESYAEFSYRLTIDKQETLIPAPKGQLVVRHAVKDMAPGRHKYKVELLKGGELASEKVRRASAFIWVDASEQEAILSRKAARGGDELLEAISLDNDGIKVGALDIYSKFFAENLDEIDMRPQMLEHIRSLKLGELLSHEGELYKKLEEEEG